EKQRHHTPSIRQDDVSETSPTVRARVPIDDARHATWCGNGVRGRTGENTIRAVEALRRLFEGNRRPGHAILERAVPMVASCISYNRTHLRHRPVRAHEPGYPRGDARHASR